MTNGEPSLELEQVVKRFSESEQALRELESQLDGLKKLDERTRASVDSVEEAASSLQEYTEETAEITAELAIVANKAGNLLERAEDVLDGTQLQRIEELVEAGHGDLESSLARHREQLDRLDKAVGNVDSGVKDTESELASVASQVEDVPALRSAVEDTDEAVSQLGSKLYQKFTSLEKAVKGSNQRITWLLASVIALQVAIIGFLMFGGG